MEKFTTLRHLTWLSVLAATPVVADQTSIKHGIIDKTPTLFAFKNATIHTSPNKVMKNATLVINNGKVISVSTKNDIPVGARIIDLAGYSIYPGFIDPYTGYGVPKAKKDSSRRQGPQFGNKSLGANAGNDAIKAEKRWVNVFSADKKSAKPYVENGFTSVQSAQLDGIFRGSAFVASLAEGRTNDLIYSANSLQFASFDKGSSRQSYPSSLMGSIALIRQTLSDANWYEKAYNKTDTRFFSEPIEYNATLEALKKIENVGVLFASDDQLSLFRADKLMASFKIPVVHLGSGHEYSRIDAIKSTGDSIILPVNFPKVPNVNGVDDNLDISIAKLRHWERAPSSASALAKNEIPFAFTLNGLKNKGDFWKNIRKAVKHGLPKDKALAALTTEPARIAGVNNVIGTLNKGKIADFVVVKGDIFEDGKIQSVWLQGKETELTSRDKTDFNGEYAFNLNNVSATLTITGKKKSSGKLTTKIADKEKKISLKNVNATDGTLAFTADLLDFDLPGVIRFSGQLNDKGIKGILVNAQGIESNFVMLKQAATEDKSKKSKKDKEKEEKSIRYLSQITSPNIAFGQKTMPSQQNVHIKNATVWTSGKAGKLENTDILIRKGKFNRIGKNLKTPSGYLAIDATGKHVTAGLIDEHSHIATSQGVNEGSHTITSEVNIGDVLNPDDISIYRGLAGGVTSIQLLHGSANPIGGQAQVIQLRWGANAEQLKFKQAPPSIKFALGENVKRSSWSNSQRYPSSRLGVETSIRDIFQLTREYQQDWADYNDLSRSKKKKVAPPRHNYRLEVLGQILDKKRFVHAHSYIASEILMLMEVADDFGFTIQTFTHILEGYKVADEIAKHGASASTFSDWWAYKFEVIDAIPSNTCLMQEKGVLTSINSDDKNIQRRLNQEAAKSIVYCGMSEIDALNMVTINPAKQLKIDKHVGSIVKGKQADFVIWNKHPLSVYAKPEQTWIEGAKYFDLASDKVNQQSLAIEKNILIQKALGAKSAGETPETVAAGISTIFEGQPTWHCEDMLDVWQYKWDMLNGGISTQQFQHSHQNSAEETH